MATDTDIANFALGHLSDDRITSLTEESEPARVMNLWFEQARTRTLRLANWTTASKTRQLAPDATAPEVRWAYRYLKPADYIRFIRLGESYQLGSEIEGDYILTDEGPSVILKYVFDLRDVSKFDADMVDTMSLILAYYGCEKITQSTERKELLLTTAGATAREAKNTDALTQGPVPLSAGSWLVDREGGRNPLKWGR